MFWTVAFSLQKSSVTLPPCGKKALLKASNEKPTQPPQVIGSSIDSEFNSHESHSGPWVTVFWVQNPRKETPPCFQIFPPSGIFLCFVSTLLVGENTGCHVAKQCKKRWRSGQKEITGFPLVLNTPLHILALLEQCPLQGKSLLRSATYW